jgi:hypothetical protein
VRRLFRSAMQLYEEIRKENDNASGI